MSRARRDPTRPLLLLVLSFLVGCEENGLTEVHVTDGVDFADAPPPSIVMTDLPDARTGQTYRTELAATGGTAPYRWSLVTGGLPRGLSLTEGGTVTGTPLASGTATFSVAVTDQNQRADTTSLSITVTLAFPEPALALDSSYVRSTGGYRFVHYDLSVTNWSAFATELFERRPDLPPCGLNANASRTWVEIFDASGARRYGFCALGSPSDLRAIWFAVPAASVPPTGVYIELWDRARDVRVRSNTVSIPTG